MAITSRIKNWDTNDTREITPCHLPPHPSTASRLGGGTSYGHGKDGKPFLAQGLPDTEVGNLPHALYDEAKKDGWVVISMKDDWKRIFAFDQ
jgi:hypothetical protein